jgi:hypothetical protein
MTGATEQKTEFTGADQNEGNKEEDELDLC